MDGADPLATFSNLLERSPGPVLSMLGAVLPGVRAGALSASRTPPRGPANRAALQASGLVGRAGRLDDPGHRRGRRRARWVGQAASRLANDGLRYRVVDLSMSGARTEDVIERQIPVLRALPAPALVTVLIGSNDMLSPAHRRLLGEAFTELIALLPDGTVFGGLPPRGPVQEANAAIAAAVARRGFVEVTVDTLARPGGQRSLPSQRPRSRRDRRGLRERDHRRVASLADPAGHA